jgi:ABC-type oligopeptide transport system substrate-binding subunit
MKKILALLLVLAMLATAMIGCAKKTDDKTDDDAAAAEKGAFPAITYLYNTSDGHKAIGEYLQAALANVGITMNLENQEWATFLDTRKEGKYTIARNGWLADYNDPICFLDMWTSNSGNNDVQFGKGAHASLKMYDLDLTKWGYDIKVEDGTWAETYDVLISTIKSCTDTTKRYEMMHLAEDILMATGCIVPLYYYTDLYMINKGVNGFFSNPLGYKYFMYTDVNGNTESINVCLSSEPDTLDPALNSAVDGATMISHLFAGLAKWSQDANGNLVIVPDCAVALPEGVANADGTVTYTYTLKDGLKWSNGDALTASDFVNSWQRAASADLAADYGYMFEVVKGYGTDALAVEAVDAKTIKVTLANAVSYWNELLAFPTYFPVHAASMANESWATDPATYICNGAYTIESWTHDSVITLAKNPAYHDAASVKMNKINCYLSDDANNMLANFKKGDWALIDDVPTNEIATLKKTHPEEFVIAGQIGTYYVCWNINENILPAGSKLTGVEAEKAQAEIRNAISLLFDRNYIVESVAQGGQLPASSFVAMGMTNPDGTEFYKTANGGAAANGYDGYYNVAKDAHKANVDKALEILAKYYDLKTK